MYFKSRFEKIQSPGYILLFLLFLFQILLVCENPAKPAPPILSLSLLSQDSIFHINTPIIVTASVSGDSYSRMLYVWIVDNGAPDTIKDFRKEYSWGVVDTGVHLISVYAIGDELFRSEKKSLSIRVKCSIPVIDAHQIDTMVLWGDTLSVNPTAHDPDGKVVAIQWKTDTDTLWYSTKPAGRTFQWDKSQTGDRLICIKAEDNDGLRSDADTVRIKVAGSSLKVKIRLSDSIIQLYQPMTFRLSSQGVFPQTYFYQWIVDDVVSRSGKDSLSLIFQKGEAGQHRICGLVLNSDSSVMCADTIKINAVYTRIEVAATLSDTVLLANMALSIAPGFRRGTLEDVEKMWLTLDQIKTIPVNKGENAVLIFNVADTGTHSILFNVLDKDSVVSNSKTYKLTVLPGAPLLSVPFKDTTISSDDTLEINPVVVDPNGTIIATEWYSEQTKKSFKTNRILISYAGFPLEKFDVAVCDNDSLRAFDTITVHFNSSPVVRPILLPPDTIYCTEQKPFADVTFSWSKYDRENDVTSTQVEIRLAGTDSIWRVNCPNDSGHIRLSTLGEYQWVLTIKDSFGNISIVNRKFAIAQAHSICFAGHSIISGMAGNGLEGGFRATVLNGLRENLSPFHKIKAFGPITTPDMTKYPADDSCYAISGAKAFEMALFLRSAYTKLTADMWVIMLGANAGYTPTELSYTIEMVDTMLARNKNARVYVLTSPPFPPDIAYLETANYELVAFNKAIYDSVAVRRAGGFKISVVDVDTLLTNSSHLFDSTWFADHVHPNMAGYHRVGNKIIEVMRLQDNPAMKEEYYLKK